MRHSFFPRLRLLSSAALVVLIIGVAAFAQSSDARFPTPVSASEIVDSIAARDLGDSRLTDYFYTFTGLPGDLLITLESKNLNGDLDVFTAGELRPLLKITFYAESTTTASKNIYLRKRESLILRIEARTPNDDPGTYRIRFTGSFEPISSGGLIADTDKPAGNNRESGSASDRTTTKVSSVGARIDEPAAEVVATPTPKPTPEAKPSPAAARSTPTKEPKRETTARTTSGRRVPPPRRSSAPAKPAASTDTGDAAKDSSKNSTTDQPPADADSGKPADAESSTAATEKSAATETAKQPAATAKKPAVYRRPPVRKNPTRAPAPKPEPEPENKALLVIEGKDGSRREFPMSSVRRVTVENGTIVIVGNDGATRRIPMSTVARMSIGP